MSNRKYREEELLDALVVDSEGHIAGRVGSFVVTPRTIIVKLYELEKKSRTEPDEEELVKRLMKVVPKKKGLLSKAPSLEDLYADVRKELGKEATEEVTLEDLVRYAEVKGVEVPQRVVEEGVKVERGEFPWGLVKKIGVSSIDKCLLLREPMGPEGKERKIQRRPPLYGTDALRGKLVIDSEGRIIGRADRFLLGIPPGILITKEVVERREIPDLDALERQLVPGRFKTRKDLYQTVAIFHGLSGQLRADDLKSRYLLGWAQSQGIDIPMIVEEEKTTEELVADWTDIGKIDDVILLKKSLEELEGSQSLK
ncbi:hypothetical protein DRO56_01910 [Candidatus Bathyarchaeota archaeon]|nr:MAG: hypothetical protein DRO56_01910 [Candidatus Bathyarchaeota archaeon]